MSLSTTFGGRKCDHTARNSLCSKIPFDRTLWELPCLRSVHDLNMLVSLSILHAVQADLCWAIDERKYRRQRRRSREQLIGALLRDNASEEGERSTEHKKIVDVQRQSDTMFPIRARHMNGLHVLVHACTRTRFWHPCSVQHVQACCEMRWPQQSHDSWPRFGSRPACFIFLGKRLMNPATLDLTTLAAPSLTPFFCLGAFSMDVKTSNAGTLPWGGSKI